MEDWRGTQLGATSSPLPAHVRLEARVLVPRVVRWEAVTGAGQVRAAGRGGSSVLRLRALNGSGGDAAHRDREASPGRLAEAARAPRAGWGPGGSRVTRWPHDHYLGGDTSTREASGVPFLRQDEA